MAFSIALEQAVRRQASVSGIDVPALLAVAEIECGGQPFEPDGRTPRFLFERHVFYKQVKAIAPAKLPQAEADGLAIPRWSRTTQYKDLGSASGRQRVITAARAVDQEAANRSCSWGVGQVMGFHAVALGYGTATNMVSSLTTGGLDAQVECFVRFIKSKPGLVEKLNRQDWAGFAFGYNGQAYAQNDYDTRLANAYARWKVKLAPVETPPDAEEEIPLARTPVQNAESRNPWTTPEGVATGVGAATGVGTAVSGTKTDGPIGYALAFVIVAAFCVGAYFFIKRMRATPT